MLLFSTQLCQLQYCPSNFLSGHPPSQSQSTVCTDSVWLGGSEGLLSCVGEHILQEFNTLLLTRFRTYKIALPPPTKNLGVEGGEGASDR
jgi:hypothetical protein